MEAINEMPLYPTEDIIWNENVVPTEYFSGEGKLLKRSVIYTSHLRVLRKTKEIIFLL